MIDEWERESKFAKEIVNFLSAFTICPSTFIKFNIQVVESLRVEVSLERIVFEFETHQVIYSIHMDLSVV